ncbi:hypothetical protein PTT_18600 [Paecilomyces variotii No. 5]|uniref:Uncharacterized protein n=1 Tax=Byssochlamys spectabilis (strain No. 5 / NBRC 109023) TaxID=1356009 RepID=V5G2X9_BYSSN|nr:hypothetical protein PTT_18600 [Paecilomyces variotii No. 5]
MRSVAILPLLLAVASARTVNFNRRADNLQTFTGDLGGAAPAVTDSGDSTKPFEVNGDTFVNQAAAVQRSCDVQFNTCADQANGGAGFSVDQCQQQKDQCSAAAGTAKRSVEERSEHITPRFSQIQVRANSNSTSNDQASRVGNIKRLVEVAERGFEKIKVRANSNSTSSRAGNIKRLVDVEERDFEKINVRANPNSTANDQASRVGNIKRNVDFEKRNDTAADFIKRGDVLDKRNNAAQNGTANFIKRFTNDMEKRAANGTAAAGQGNNAAQQFGQAAKEVGGIVQGLGNLLGGGGAGGQKASAPFGLKPRKIHFFRS